MNWLMDFWCSDSSVLKHVKLPNDASEVKEFDPKLGEFERHSFEHKGKYLFVKVTWCG